MTMDDFGLWVSIFGALLTIYAVFLARRIYQRQKVEQHDSTLGIYGRLDQQKEIFDAQIELLKAIAQQANAEVAPKSLKPDTPVDEDARATVSADVFELEGVTVYQPQDIPLRVLGDLIQGWREQGDFEENKNWLLGEVERALHKRGAKGNHAWRIVLVNRDDMGKRFVWKVSRGGQGKTAPTVTDETRVYEDRDSSPQSTA
jgi:hypothetical protein